MKGGENLNVEKVKQKMQEHGLTLYRLSIKSKVAYSTLHDIIISEKAGNPRIDTVIKIADALGEKIENLIWKWGYLYDKGNSQSKEK